MHPEICSLGMNVTHFLLQQLMGRMGTEAECGLAALYLAAEATFCTGIDLLLSGGAELNYGFKSQIQSSQS